VPRFHCPRCDSILELGHPLAGTLVTCYACGAKIPVPTASAASPPHSTPPTETQTEEDSRPPLLTFWAKLRLWRSIAATVIATPMIMFLAAMAYGWTGLIVASVVTPILAYFVIRREWARRFDHPERPKPKQGLWWGVVPPAVQIGVASYEEARQYADLDKETIAQAGPRGASHAQFH
jgi:hypothetical protein